MSPQDSQMLNDFLNQLTQARGIQKDPEADALIRRAVDRQPDAAYLLVQRALLLDQALNNAKSRIASLEQQVSQLSQQDGDGRFLDPNAWGNSGRSAPAQSAQREYPRDVQTQYQTHQQPQYQPQYPGQYQPAYPQPGLSSGFLRGGLGGGLGGGMLGSIAATAAGVAAGSFLFHGLDNMFHHHDQGGGNHLLNSDDPGNNLFSDQSGSALADQAGLGDIGGALDSGGLDGGVASEGLFDSSVDDVSDNSGGFFDGDGSDEGLFG